MKLLLFLSCFLFACTNIASTGPSYAMLVSQTDSEPLLKGIQAKIYGNFVQALMQKSNDELVKVEEQLEQLYQDKQQNIIQYWRGYNAFYHAIYFLQQGDLQEAEYRIDHGIELMDALEVKNSEDYALLAMMRSFSIQFKGMKAMFISQTVNQEITAALAADPDNLRAHFVGGSNDYYTPEEYGGGKKVERYLKKAISLPAQKVPNDYLPSWGKEEAYEMLIKFYIRKKQWENAKTYYQQGIEELPDSYLLNQLASKLVGK